MEKYNSNALCMIKKRKNIKNMKKWGWQGATRMGPSAARTVGRQLPRRPPPHSKFVKKGPFNSYAGMHTVGFG